MLVSYSISNFKSIKYDRKISLLPKPLKHKREILKNNLLPVLSIYGPNGGGKSSIIESIWIMINFVLKSNDKNTLEQLLDYSYQYKNKEWKDKPIKWKIELDIIGDLYIYELSVNNSEIIYESLDIIYDYRNKNRKTNIFKKIDNELRLNSKLEKIRNFLSNYYGSIVSYINILGVDENIKMFFNEINKIEVISSTEHLDQNSLYWTMSNIMTPNLNSSKYIIENMEKNKDKLLEIFKEIDINIIDIIFEKNNFDGVKNITFKKNSDFGEIEIPFIQESAGTKKIIQLMALLLNFIHDESIIFIDELDSQLHTKLLGYIIQIFYSNYNKNSQLIFSSHDIGTLDSEYFRKDQIYFAALNDLYFTDLVCLNEFGDEIRENSSFSKKYLSGELGYDPYIRIGSEIWK